MIKIKNRNISEQNKVFFIAEIGVNHCGKLNLAKKMIDAAIKSGADAVKFQTFTAEALSTPQTKKVKYQLKNTRKKETHYQMLESLELSKENHKKLFSYCVKKNIIFLSTPYDKESAKFLNDLGCAAFKTASADLIDLELHKYLASTKKPVIISTGMANLKEIEDCLKIYKKIKNKKIILLHCVSNYPCSKKSLNLNSINLLKNKFKVMVGYSDHSEGSEAIMASVALGSVLIEKHFTIDRSLPGPDQKTSILPKELKRIVDDIKTTQEILGKAKKMCQPEELGMKMTSRKSLTLRKDLRKSQKLKRAHLVLKRPGTGIPMSKIKNILGKYVKRNLKSNYQIKLSDLKQ